MIIQTFFTSQTQIQQVTSARIGNRVQHVLLWTLLMTLAGCGARLPYLNPPASQTDSAGALPEVRVRNNQGGALSLRGELNYSNVFFTLGVAQPMIILEDQAGFVDRNRRFLLPLESQVLGQITSDFFDSPVSYSLDLPLQPQGTVRDVDNDGQRDAGVMIFAVAYWSNIFGDPFLEERDLQGGGWSSAYASTRVSNDADTWGEITGGKLVVYAADDQQGFPSDFGGDGRLFSGDEPTVRLPPGYTVVDLDHRPFLFDRSSRPVIDLIEPDTSALEDFSGLSYGAAFDTMLEKLRKEYAFSEYKAIDWEAKRDEFRPRFVEAEQTGDPLAYLRALRDFALSIPDGHVAGPFIVDDFQQATDGGIGLTLKETGESRFFATKVAEESPAAQAGIKPRAEILAIDGKSVALALQDTINWLGPASTAHVDRSEKLRFVTRSPVGSEMQILYRNPGEQVSRLATLTSQEETLDYDDSGQKADELPVIFKLLTDESAPDEDKQQYGYIQITSFSDNELLTVQLWEHALRTVRQQNVAGMILDMRRNSGGNGFLADQMAAYFFDQALDLGNTGYYDPLREAFVFEPQMVDRFFLAPEELRYHGKLAVLVGPGCQSACEFFSYDLTLEQRAVIVGQYPTAGLGGSVEQFLMPENEYFQFTAGRAVDMQGRIHIEGKGIAPTIQAPNTPATLFAQEFEQQDVVLDAALEWLREQSQE